MSLWNMSNICAVAIVAFLVRQSIGGPTLFIDPNASMQENREVQPVYEAQQNPTIAKKKIEDILKKNPQNRPVKVLMARLLLQEGDVTTAWETIEPLLAGKAAYRPAVRLQLELAQASGNKKMEASAYVRMLAKRRKDIDILAGKAESEGDIVASEKMRKQAVAASPLKMRMYKQYELGQFYLCQGQFDKAISTLKSALPRIEKLGVEWVSRVHMDCALAFWGKGNREEAIKESLAAAEAIANPTAGDTELRAAAVMMAHILVRAGVGTTDDRTKANDLLNKSIKTMHATKPHSLGAVVLAATGKDSKEDVAARIKAVLKTAPHLDWALWAALYMGLSEPEHAKDLLKLLPEKSLQRQIADIEQKAKARTATQKAARPRNK